MVNLAVPHRRWDALLALDILAHWADATTAAGWVPRELILGVEARIRVAPEALLQDPMDESMGPPVGVIEALGGSREWAGLEGEAEEVSGSAATAGDGPRCGVGEAVR